MAQVCEGGKSGNSVSKLVFSILSSYQKRHFQDISPSQAQETSDLHGWSQRKFSHHTKKTKMESSPGIGIISCLEISRFDRRDHRSQKTYYLAVYFQHFSKKFLQSEKFGNVGTQVLLSDPRGSDRGHEVPSIFERTGCHTSSLPERHRHLKFKVGNFKLDNTNRRDIRDPFLFENTKSGRPLELFVPKLRVSDKIRIQDRVTYCLFHDICSHQHGGNILPLFGHSVTNFGGFLI
jgi:hypothetical protein